MGCCVKVGIALTCHIKDCGVLVDEATKFPSMTGHSLSGVALSLPLPRPSLMLISLTGSGMVRVHVCAVVVHGAMTMLRQCAMNIVSSWKESLVTKWV